MRNLHIAGSMTRWAGRRANRFASSRSFTKHNSLESAVANGRHAPSHGTPRVSALQAAVAGAFIALPMLFAAAPARAVQCIVTDLGALGGTVSAASGINAAGQVVGYAFNAGNVNYRAFLWQSGSLQDLGTLGGTNSMAHGINDAGQVVGESFTSANAARRAFLGQPLCERGPRLACVVRAIDCQ